MYNQFRQDFPVLNSNFHDKQLIYLDNAATSQKPSSVLQAVKEYYQKHNANPYRGLYGLSVKATDAYESARKLTAEFIHADNPSEVIFTRNTTEALNLLAYSYGRSVLKSGDEIVLSISEHHSNIIPWQQVAKEKGAVLKYLYLSDDGRIIEEDLEKKITERTKIVSIAHVSNVLGTIHPIEKIIQKAHSVGAVAVVDTAQGIPHYPVDVQKLDVDFLAFSGHKMLAPMGIGVLYGKEKLLNAMPPFLTGGEMIEIVSEQDATFAPLPHKFEAGTPNVGGAVGLAAAIEYINHIGYETIQNIEEELTDYALQELNKLPEITIYGDKVNCRKRCGVISFNVNGVHPHDTASILDGDGIAVRAGHHCAQPLMKYLNVPATCRISFYFYNTKEEINLFIQSLKKVRRLLGYGN
ncbi:SufS family cysteine desulfurase [Anaerocolumna sedimenticola]|uniref:Cysteine desulfurase n=1 Tax=Anaerocolumna sedimenticola TaxID=2696063 RepID=A0A6P1TQC5_9FIRM|nr:cysteine desulfurase [Anaerocolumna sedimenticola]QHQ61765.1 SufS family cysteine desulfurase [Anaerocolumna sedimenticola]